MKVRLKSNILVMTGETPAEIRELQEWSQRQDGFVFALKCQDAQTVRLTCLGARADACRQPINITSRSPDAAVQLISNLASTPFELDGERYESIEAYWQGLKFPELERRRTIGLLSGQEARRAGFDAVPANVIQYAGREVRVGTAEHWHLMAIACWAKFNQNSAARDALLSTGERPLEHRMRRDSRNIPGVVMADIWMKVRRRLRTQRADADPAIGDDLDFDSTAEETDTHG